MKSSHFRFTVVPKIYFHTQHFSKKSLHIRHTRNGSRLRKFRGKSREQKKKGFTDGAIQGEEQETGNDEMGNEEMEIRKWK